MWGRSDPCHANLWGTCETAPHRALGRALLVPWQVIDQRQVDADEGKAYLEVHSQLLEGVLILHALQHSDSPVYVPMLQKAVLLTLRETPKSCAGLDSMSRKKA